MVKSGLINHGWTYINIDDFWEVNPSRTNDPTLQGPERDAQGRILPNPRFPDMKGLADYVHGLGLKIGLYSSPGPWTCGGCVASYQHEEQDATAVRRLGLRLPQVRLVQLRPDRRRATAAAASRPGNVQKPYRGHAGRAGQGPARHHLQPLPVRHGQRVGVGRGGRRQQLAHDRRHHGHLGQPDAASASGRPATRSMPARATSTTPTCWSSARSAGVRACTPRA